MRVDTRIRFVFIRITYYTRPETSERREVKQIALDASSV